jgi:hypothetical protein
MNNDDDRLHGLNNLDNLDKLIDRALDSYTPREPRPGLTERVLSSQASVEAMNRIGLRTDKPIWALAVAVALLAVALIPLWVKSPRPTVAIVHPPTVTLQDSLRTATTLTALPHPARNARASIAQHVVSETQARARLTSDSNEFAVFAPIVMKPIAMAPIRIGEPN